MSNDRKHQMDEALDQASRWVARELSGKISRAEKAELDKWRATNAENDQAYKWARRGLGMLERTSQADARDLLARGGSDIGNLLEECSDQAAIMRGERGPLKTYRRAASIAASLALLFFVTLVAYQIAGGKGADVYETAVGEQYTVMLADGSVITLNTDTRISAALSATERRILFHHGEAFFEVAKDRTRPFTVVVGNDIVQAVGTAFNVRRRETTTRVTVIEGIVEFRQKNLVSGDKADPKRTPADSGSQIVRLNVGEELIVQQAQVKKTTLATAELARAASWRQGHIYFDGEPISQIVRELQYYASKEIVLADDMVANLIAGGSFDTRNVTSFLRGLEAALPIRLIEREAVIILIYDDGAAKEATF